MVYIYPKKAEFRIQDRGFWCIESKIRGHKARINTDKYGWLQSVRIRVHLWFFTPEFLQNLLE